MTVLQQDWRRVNTLLGLLRNNTNVRKNWIHNGSQNHFVKEVNFVPDASLSCNEGLHPDSDHIEEDQR